MAERGKTEREQEDLHTDSQQLAKSLRDVEQGGDPVTTTLSTDEKVIARITDGIYRQPASALRELISNAYDADATSVSIETDYPRFEQIIVRDDGNGMGEEALANLILHIGGSAKRGRLGRKIGVTSSDDSTKTIAGRAIIGKIGIGLFSVAQLTQQFQIITKVKGNNYRLVADVTLKTFTEDELTDAPQDQKFESGRVEIRKVKAVDIDAKGTDIILMNLRKNALSILRSEDIWVKVSNTEDDSKRQKYSPTYHIGQYKKEDNNFFSEAHKMCLPWKENIDVSDRFKSVYDSVLDELGRTRETPRLENTFDNYFQMLWTLALSSPIDYIDKHPFLLTKTQDDPRFFQVSNSVKGQAEDIDLEEKTYQEIKGMIHPVKDPAGGFNVFVDGIKLYRPIAFNDQKKSNSALQTPLMFYGSYKADYGEENRNVTGGKLEFEAYFFWNSKILPLDHNGISIRISNASGTLFDSRWLGYPVAERTTLGQISAEIYVVKGLDAALNIDRESFNYSHPHYQILSKWVYNALRQITAKQKNLRSEINKQKKVEAHKGAVKGLYETNAAKSVAALITNLPEIVDSSEDVIEKREQGITAFSSSDVFARNHEGLENHKLRLIVGVLEARGLMSELSYAEQESLVRDLAEILTFGE